MSKLLFYAYFATSSLGIFKAGGSNNTISHLTGEKLRAHCFAFPPRHEQDLIAAALDMSSREIEESRALVSDSIRLIAECRTRLIADVMTGKLDVGAAAANLPDLVDAEPEPVDTLDDDASLDAAEEPLEEEVAS